METYLFHQIAFVRNQTVRAVQGLTEDALDRVPEGFNNNIRWNLGHIYQSQERFAFQFAGEPTELPDAFPRLFARGTKPADWNEEPPSGDMLLAMMARQPERIRQTLAGRLHEKAKEPFTTSTGLTLDTVGAFLTYTLYHEGMHYQAIALLKRFGSS